MKTTCALLVFFVATSFSYATTLADIVKLSKVQTSDDLIVRLIQEDPFDGSLNTGDVIFLKEQGVSERVINYLLLVTKSERVKLPTQEGESIRIAEGVRAYYTTGRDGKKKMIITNLDENGVRMGPPPPETPPATVAHAEMPSEPLPAEMREQAYEPPREIYVTVRSEQPVGPAQGSYDSYPPAPYLNTYYPTYYSTSAYYPGSYQTLYPSYYRPFSHHFQNKNFSFQSGFQFRHHPSAFASGFCNSSSFKFHHGFGFPGGQSSHFGAKQSTVRAQASRH